MGQYIMPDPTLFKAIALVKLLRSNVGSDFGIPVIISLFPTILFSDIKVKSAELIP